MSADADSSALESELALVVASPEFVRSTVLRRLLDYLVAQTLAGNGPRLKAYHIAVEGLGRADNFDPQSDSYPRVQVGRLRKMLDLHYATLSPQQAKGRRRISIPLGQYDVQLLPFTPALPEPALSKPEPDAQQDSAPPATGRQIAALAPAETSAKPLAMDRGWLLWVIRALLLFALVYLIWLLARPDRTELSGNLRDIHGQVAHVVITTSPAGGNEDVNAAAQIAEMQLQKFEMLAVSMDDGNAGQAQANPAREYQLIVRGGIKQGDAQTSGQLFLTLRHAMSGTTLWSLKLARQQPGKLTGLEQLVGEGISQIARSGGLIAQHQRRLIGNDRSAGYPCLVHYDAFRQTRDPALRQPLKACLTQSLERYPAEPLVLQALSYLELTPPRLNLKAPLVASAKGRELAEAALSANSGSSLAQIAVARSALTRGNCPRAMAFAQRAAQSNPLEPDTTGVAGSLLMSCGDFAGAQPMLERAMAMSSESGDFRTASLVITRMLNGDARAALDLAILSDSQVMTRQPMFLMSKALALAANGRTAAAQQTWQALEKSVEAKPGAPVADVLARFTLSPRFSRRMEAEAVRLGLGGQPG